MLLSAWAPRELAAPTCSQGTGDKPRLACRRTGALRPRQPADGRDAILSQRSCRWTLQRRRSRVRLEKLRAGEQKPPADLRAHCNSKRCSSQLAELWDASSHSRSEHRSRSFEKKPIPWGRSLGGTSEGKSPHRTTCTRGEMVTATAERSRTG